MKWFSKLWQEADNHETGRSVAGTVGHQQTDQRAEAQAGELPAGTGRGRAGRRSDGSSERVGFLDGTAGNVGGFHQRNEL